MGKILIPLPDHVAEFMQERGYGGFDREGLGPIHQIVGCRLYTIPTVSNLVGGRYLVAEVDELEIASFDVGQLCDGTTPTPISLVPNPDNQPAVAAPPGQTTFTLPQAAEYLGPWCTEDMLYRAIRDGKIGTPCDVREDRKVTLTREELDRFRRAKIGDIDIRDLPNLPSVLSLIQAAAVLNRTVKAVRALIECGNLKKAGGKGTSVRIPRQDIWRYLGYRG